jgi:hypothetical protein
MPRPKGPGAIKFLDATKQDEVAMRNLLWRGTPSQLHDELNALRTQRAELTVQLIDLRTLREALRRLINHKAAPVMARANARMELPSVNTKIDTRFSGANHLDCRRASRRRKAFRCACG